MASEYTPREAGALLVQAIAKKLEAVSADLARLQKAEAEGMAALQPKPVRKMEKTVFQVLSKAETFISNTDPADPEKRDVTKGKPGPTLPHDRKEKSVSAPGSGGKMEKADADPAKPTAPVKPPAPKLGAPAKPAGVPAAKVGAAPSIPKPPKAPGAAGMTAKSEPGVFAKLKMKKGY